MEAYRQIDAQYFGELDIDTMIEGFVEKYGEEPSVKNCDYYPESCGRCKIKSRCKEGR